MEAINPQKLSPQEQEVYKHVQNTIAQAHDQVRLLSHNLLPEELEKQGLWEALQQLVRKLNRNTPVKWVLTLPQNLPRFDAKTEFELYSIVLELTNNVLKHAQATEGKVECRVQNGECRMVVSDNGVGMTEKRTNGKGMNSVESRVKSLNGQLHIHTQAGEGTRFEVWV
jgi:signal transduction histidine kinase